jgi:type II secretory ATPase GspE/PulE/Tfp pilus assembly ATPase PilB-like protein
MTGHLVFSTVHTNDSASAVARLHEMGVPSFLISSTIECILAQRLVRKICSECKEPLQATQEMIDYLGAYGVDTKNLTLMHGKGCTTCNSTGYKGRCGLHELLVMDEEIRRFTLKELAGGPISELARKRGMRPMVQDGLIKVTMGITTIEEVLTAAQ